MQDNIQELEQNQVAEDLEQPKVSKFKRVPFASISKLKHIQSDGVYIKATYVPANVKFYTKHTPDNHVAILAYGQLVMLDGEQKTHFSAPATYVIPSNSRIAFFTLTECVFYCVHATQETDLDTLDRIY